MGAAASSPGGAGASQAGLGSGDNQTPSAAGRDLFASAVVDVPSSAGVKHVVILGNDFVNNFAVFPSQTSVFPPHQAKKTNPNKTMQEELKTDSPGPVVPRDDPSADLVQRHKMAGTERLGLEQSASPGETPFLGEKGDSLSLGGGQPTQAQGPDAAAMATQQKKELLSDMRNHLKAALVEQMTVLRQGLAACPLTQAAASAASATADASLRQVASVLPEERETVSPGSWSEDIKSVSFPRPTCHDEQLAVLQCYSRQRKGEKEGRADYLSCHSVVADLRACSERATQLAPLTRQSAVN
ncbi:conserved hypothetical protein [Neospora caninum Liverpool]|uniref:Uncharacterized protein n=1 Tax=Neospora caninum (strain Liverpool) TaxID=572307 RepID=F0VAA7_NEOCL|nr:conserved hypothetical protein [Neospora caninum Liverpool]CBZ50596.1 conserved hypothetical protein [Neospora caninum Liverpool]CEL65209.1 TPA: hypothetical protein BN1204_010650 [Neospora caninum Liverpool]|eukprot:XP_003880629.1 conserved hypothetical protein [Neospora caninum Liverpool]